MIVVMMVVVRHSCIFYSSIWLDISAGSIMSAYINYSQKSILRKEFCPAEHFVILEVILKSAADVSAQKSSTISRVYNT